jgi:hypothetical protein
MAEESGKVVFDMPEGAVSLQELAEDDTVELAAVFRKEPDGKICLVEVEGVEVSSYEDEDEDEDEEEEVNQDAAGGDMISAMDRM